LNAPEETSRIEEEFLTERRAALDLLHAHRDGPRHQEHYGVTHLDLIEAQQAKFTLRRGVRRTKIKACLSEG
jgi:hypothetical protein